MIRRMNGCFSPSIGVEALESKGQFNTVVSDAL